jgi:hypothetical protein
VEVVMQSGGWRSLLRGIPKKHHANLLVVTSGGTEINIQKLIRLKEDYLVFRGRIAGSTEEGKIYFLPFDHIDFLGFQQALTEDQVNSLFGSRQAASAAPAGEATPPSPVLDKNLGSVSIETPLPSLSPSSPTEGVPSPTLGSVPVAEMPEELSGEVTGKSLPSLLKSKSDVVQRLRQRAAIRSAAETQKQ